MRSNTHLFLSRIAYSAVKRQITVEFSNTFERVSKKYSFFPKMHFSLGKISKESFSEVLSKFDLQRLKISFNDNKATIFGATFSDLKKVNNLLSTFFDFQSNLIEPERQFLIEKGWSYFDCFEHDSGELILSDSLKFPDVRFGFLSDSLKATVADLLKNNKQLAKDIVEKIVSSKLLRIPLVEREEVKELEEIFLENVFFESSLPIKIGKTFEKKQKKSFKDRTQIDFSKLVSIMASKPFNNIGVESINCSCCKPNSIDAQNVLPSSLVKVRFLREGFYFDSISKTWANDFHEKNSFKEQREQRRKEYYSDFYSIGPFSRNQEEFVLLADAFSLQEKGLVSSCNGQMLEWCCLRKESSFSSQINFLKKSLSLLSSNLEKESTSFVASKGLFYSQAIDYDPGFFYRKTLKKSVSELLSSLTIHLTNPESRFFNKGVAVNFEILIGRIFADFEGVVSSSSDSRVLFNSSNALVDPSSLLSVSKKFAELYNVDKELLSLRTS